MRVIRKLALAFAFGGAMACFGQTDWHATLPTGNVITGGEYLGANTNSTVPLLLKTIPDLRIDFSTSNVQRMGINPKISYGLGSFGAAPRNGFVGISGRPGLWTAAKGPFSRLHLADDAGDDYASVYAQGYGYRPWMRNGITFTGNSDQAFLGQKYGDNDVTDFVLQWSDNVGGDHTYGPDRLKFVFSSPYIPSAIKGSSTYDGLEAMRMWPKTDTEVNVGIGNFAPTGTGDPTERLDLLTGRVRLRDLPLSPSNNALIKVLVVDDVNPLSPEFGVVKWRDASTLGGGGGGGACGSGWSLNGNSPVTAYNGNPCIPQAPDFVGIGTSTPNAKLEIMKDYTNVLPEETALRSTVTVSGGPMSIAMDAANRSAAAVNAGVRATTTALNRNFGVITTATGFSDNWAISNYGVESRAEYGIFNCGVNSRASYGSDCRGVTAFAGFGTNSNIAIRALATGPNALSAQFFGDMELNGAGTITNGPWSPSDETLKTNIQDITEADAVLMQLHPKTYDFLTAQHPKLGLPEGTQMGLLAQDLASVLPQFVRDFREPEELDSLGNVIAPAETYKSINYTALIPLLIAGYQEQQATIAQLQEQINNCCAAQGVQRSAPQGAATGAGAPGQEALTINPNPFTDRTTVTYTVPSAGQVQLTVSTADGRPLETLRQEKAQAGTFTYEWNTQGLAAGTYLCTLLLDGKVVVKKAVKVGR